MPALRALSPRQQRFIDEYCRDPRNATKAAIRAGYSERTARFIASENLTKPDIRTAIDAKMAKKAEKFDLTADKVLRDLEDARIGAAAAEQYSASVRASELQGRHIGMWAEAQPVDNAGKLLSGLASSLPELGRHVAFLLARAATAGAGDDAKPVTVEHVEPDKGEES